MDENIGKEFTRQTGVPVKYITGGTIDRLEQGQARQDAGKRHHLQYRTSAGCMSTAACSRSRHKLPNYANLVDRAKVSLYHIGRKLGLCLRDRLPP